REALEVGLVVALALGIVPELYWHHGEGPRADELARLALAGLAVVIEGIDGEAESATLQLAAPHGLDRATQRKAGNNVGAAGDGGELHARFERVINVIVVFRHQRRAGGEDRPHTGHLLLRG